MDVGLSALRRVAFLLERELAPTYRVKAFRTAASVLEQLPAAELTDRAATGRLTDLNGIGPKTSAVFMEAAGGSIPAYLAELEAKPAPSAGSGTVLLDALKGDLHVHSDWSDGGSPIEEMARTAMELGHSYAVLTDHSPRLTVANGLTPERLRKQLGVVAEVNAKLAPFRLLTGIEVDILDDGQLDQEPDLLAQLDVVVASVHSKLRMDSDAMTARMVSAIANPNVDVLGHCTGRMVTGDRKRPESTFDADLIFEACRQFDVAVEINCRPERRDPPSRLMTLAVERGCMFSIDTDAHAPGQLAWQPYGCARAIESGVTPDRIVNAWEVDELLAWTR
ncbi:MAG TPA: PHP domain-containing protein [Actinomycetes bacterium]|nr:PHP domain-containing protein [Actinomycetes bacterium]